MDMVVGDWFLNKSNDIFGRVSQGYSEKSQFAIESVSRLDAVGHGGCQNWRQNLIFVILMSSPPFISRSMDSFEVFFLGF